MPAVVEDRLLERGLFTVIASRGLCADDMELFLNITGESQTRRIPWRISARSVVRPCKREPNSV